MKAQKIFSIVLLISILASTVGIARVSHFCKMSKVSSCEITCHPADDISDKCCDEPGTLFSEGNDCCQSIIKLYQQQLITLVKEVDFKFFPLENNLPSGTVLFYSMLSGPGFNSVIPFSHGFPVGDSGRQINLLYGVFLI